MSTGPPPAPGWYPDARAGMQRYWNGTAWTGDVAPLPPVQAAPVVVQTPRPKKFVTRGVSQTEHLMHLVLTVLTCGFWLPVWLLRMLAGKHRQVAKY